MFHKKGFYKISNLELCEKIFSKIQEFSDECSYECPVECDSTKFDYSSGQLGASGNTFNFRFYYSHLSYMELSQIPKMTDFDLVSAVGGSLGLFLGFQFLSLIEILQYFFDLFSIIIFNR